MSLICGTICFVLCVWTSISDPCISVTVSDEYMVFRKEGKCYLSVALVSECVGFNIPLDT